MDPNDHRSSFYSKKSSENLYTLTNIIEQNKEEDDKNEPNEPASERDEQVSPIESREIKSLTLPQSDKIQKNPKKKNELNEFASAWKTETNLNVLFIEKISSIISHYFKMLPQIKKRNQEIQILTNYNIKLIEILQLFQEKEKKLMNKLRAIEELSSQCMAQLCSLKGKPFKQPQIREQVSIFHKFSLTNFEYNTKEQKPEEQDIGYKIKIEKFMREYLKSVQFDQKTILKEEESMKEIEENDKKREQFKEKEKLVKEMLDYNKKIKKANFDDLFDLYRMKKQITAKLSSKSQIINADDQRGLDIFVDKVQKMHANIMKLDETTLQNFLKNQKQIRKKLKKQRTQQQQTFVKVCEKIQTENAMLKQEVAQYKSKIEASNVKMSQLKAEIDYRNMKVRANISKSSNMDDSMTYDADSKMTRRLLKQNMKSLEKQVNQLRKYKESKQQNQDLSRAARQKIIQKLREQQIILKANIDDQIGFSNALSEKLIETRKQITEAHRQDSLISPNLQGICVLGTHNQFLKAIPEFDKEELDKIEQNYKAEIAALKAEIESLRARLRQLEQKSKTLQKDISDKQTLIKDQVDASQKQIHEKITKINELVVQYEGLSAQIRSLTFQNKILSKREEIAQILGNNIIDIAQRVQNLDEDDMNYSENVKKMLEELVSQTKIYESERLREGIEEKILMGFDEKTSSKKVDPSEQNSIHSSISNLSPLKSKNKKSHTQKSKKVFQKKNTLKEHEIETVPVIHKKLSAQSPTKTGFYNDSSPTKINLLQIPNNINDVVLPRSLQEEVSISQKSSSIKEPPRLKPGTELGFSKKSPKNDKIKNEEEEWNEKSVISNLIQSIVKEIDEPEKSKSESNIKEKQFFGESKRQSSFRKERPSEVFKIQDEIFKDINDVLGRDSHEPNQEEQNGSHNKLIGMPALAKQRNSVDLKDSHSLAANLLNSFEHNKKSSSRNFSMEDSHNKSQEQSSIPMIRINSPKESRIQSQKSHFGKKSIVSSYQMKSAKGESEVSLNISEDPQNNLKEIQECQIQQLGLSQSQFERILNRLKKLKDDSDVIDFISLYQRYKQAVNCLDRAERINKYHERKYQNFVRDLQEKRNINPKQYSYEEQIYHLTRKVNEQMKTLEEQQWQFDCQFGQQIKQSQITIKEHLKLIRSQEIGKRAKMY